MSKQERKHLKGKKEICPYCGGDTKKNYYDDCSGAFDYECCNCAKLWNEDGSPLDMGYGWEKERREEKSFKNKFKRFREVEI
jgi:predicted amidophosphoribosyltransferase